MTPSKDKWPRSSRALFFREGDNIMRPFLILTIIAIALVVVILVIVFILPERINR